MLASDRQMQCPINHSTWFADANTDTTCNVNVLKHVSTKLFAATTGLAIYRSVVWLPKRVASGPTQRGTAFYEYCCNVVKCKPSRQGAPIEKAITHLLG